jgi:hypothetical protein
MRAADGTWTAAGTAGGYAGILVGDATVTGAHLLRHAALHHNCLRLDKSLSKKTGAVMSSFLTSSKWPHKLCSAGEQLPTHKLCNTTPGSAALAFVAATGLDDGALLARLESALTGLAEEGVRLRRGGLLKSGETPTGRSTRPVLARMISTFAPRCRKPQGCIRCEPFASNATRPKASHSAAVGGKVFLSLKGMSPQGPQPCFPCELGTETRVDCSERLGLSREGHPCPQPSPIFGS